MATYVLVHGSWHGSWCWKRVRKALSAAGHDVFTPTLTGVGERSHLASAKINLSTHISDVANLIRWEELTNVILCGHSYAGWVISGVADRIPDRIRALVYLDAFVIEDGECFFDHLPPAEAERRRQQAKMTGEGWKVDPLQAEIFKVNERDRAWVNTQCTVQPIGTFEERLNLRDGIQQISDITHILCTGWERTPFPASHERAKRRGWKTRTMACGHEAMLDSPEEVVALLTEMASDNAQRRHPEGQA
jgi:pimeloyl-ACP methyl ester carboxylesterase